jgi:hypothetical protein
VRLCVSQAVTQSLHDASRYVSPQCLSRRQAGHAVEIVKLRSRSRSVAGYQVAGPTATGNVAKPSGWHSGMQGHHRWQAGAGGAAGGPGSDRGKVRQRVAVSSAGQERPFRRFWLSHSLILLAYCHPLGAGAVHHIQKECRAIGGGSGAQQASPRNPGAGRLEAGHNRSPTLPCSAEIAVIPDRTDHLRADASASSFLMWSIS